MQWDNVDFDEQDRNLFQVPDPRLRADALKHSILPRLRIILNKCIAKIRDIYGVEALEDSIVSAYPSFRPKRREREVQHLYEQAFAGLGGKRVKNLWHGFQRQDGKPVQIVPFRFGLYLTAGGLGIHLENGWLKGLTLDSYRKLYDFHLEREAIVTSLCFHTEILPHLYYGGSVRPIAPFREHYRFMRDEGIIDNHFATNPKPFPLSEAQIKELVFNYALFFPVYDSYLRIAKGESIRFEELVSKANDWPGPHQDNLPASRPGPPEDAAILETLNLAETKTRVMPALRWQVFQRDQWKCVACGRNSHGGVILQIDHILPRSRGGKDTLENFQTLCNECNLGKSNKDTTNLRNTLGLSWDRRLG